MNCQEDARLINSDKFNASSEKGVVIRPNIFSLLTSTRFEIEQVYEGVIRWVKVNSNDRI